MGLQYVVAKRIFGFDKDKNVKYVAKSVGAGELDFDKLCAKVSRIYCRIVLWCHWNFVYLKKISINLIN